MLTIVAALLQVLQPGDTGRTGSGLWYQAGGAGPGVVFVHGTNLDARSWGILPATVAGGHRVVVVDARTHGRSADATGPFSWVDDLLEVFRAAGVDRPIVVGHSMGAQVAVDLAVAHPDRVGGLILIGPAIGGMPMARMPEGMADLISAVRAQDWAGAGLALARMPTMRLRRDSTEQAALAAMLSGNTRLFRADPRWIRPIDPPAFGRLASIAVPVLIVSGSLDPTGADRAAAALVAGVKAAREVRLEGCGHLIPIDCPAELAEAVSSFLADPSRPRSAPPRR